MRASAEGRRWLQIEVFSSLTEEDFKYTATGYGIGTSICRNGNKDTWADYEIAEARRAT